MATATPSEQHARHIIAKLGLSAVHTTSDGRFFEMDEPEPVETMYKELERIVTQATPEQLLEIIWTCPADALPEALEFQDYNPKSVLKETAQGCIEKMILQVLA